ncbi:MAG: hypothetical protein ACUVR4_10885 [Anaerolineae bacterium]
MKRLVASARVPLVLGMAAALLTVIGLVLLGLYFFTSRQLTPPVAGWRDPISLVTPEAVAADLAVLTLAGEGDDRVIRAALEAGEVETAYATLAYSVLLPDSARSGHWLLLAGDYRARDAGRAAVCYQAALDLASLGPSLSDLARADVSLQVARGYGDLQQRWVAPLALAQAENIARYSLTLLPAQRRSLLLQVISAYEALGEAQLAGALRSRLDLYAAGAGMSGVLPSQLLPSLRGAVVLPQAVTAALAQRQAAAANLAGRWFSVAPAARASLADALGQALRNEDAARLEWYAGADALSMADRLPLWHDQVAWLTVKYRVAGRGYGLSLVPEWEQERAELAAALAGAYTDLINGYGQQLAQLDPLGAAQARLELLRQGVLWARLGLFPDRGAEALLSEQLAEASRQLWTRQGGMGLTIVVQDVQGQRFYLLSGADSPAGQ